MRRLSGRHLAIAAVATAATVAGGTFATVKAFATSGHETSARTVTTAVQLPGISSQALARFSVRLESPSGRGVARITADAARHVALPLGEGPQSDGWSIVVGSPVLALADFHASATVSRTCLCWAVELNSANGIPCDGASGAATADICDNHHLVELIDASNGVRWLSISGNGLG